MATNNAYGAIALTGGADGALDDILEASLNDKDISFVLDNANSKYYMYWFDDDYGAGTEVSPEIINSDDDAGGAWLQLSPHLGDSIKSYFGSGSDISMYFDGSDFIVYDEINSDILIEFNPGAETSFYQENTECFRTYLNGSDAGLSIYKASAHRTNIYHDSEVLEFHNKSVGGSMEFYALDPGSTEQIILELDGSAGHSMKAYYGGNQKLATTNVGIDVTGLVYADTLTLEHGTGETLAFANAGANWEIYDSTNDGIIYLSADNAAGVKHTLALFSSGSVGLYHANTARGNTNSEGWNIDSVLSLQERSSDPSEPSEGETKIWMSDGTGYGDDGDVCIASKAGGTTNKAILFDHSAGAAW